MPDTEPTLLLTRPEAQSQAFLSLCETRLARRIPVVISPLMRIEPLGDLPDLERFATIVVTSGNGVERLGAALAGRRVMTVGKRTANKARDLGAEARALGENVDAFLTHAEDIPDPVLVVRGVHSRGNLTARLAETGHEVEEAILYDQVAVPLNSAARRLLAGSSPVVAPVFSPRTSQLLAATTIEAPLTVIAISQAAAEAWRGVGEVRVAERPDAEAVCDLVRQAF